MPPLRIKGVNYDLGVALQTNGYKGYNLSEVQMYEELYAIKNDLNCNAIRIYGEEIDKLIECAEIAIRLGLQVWFSPRLINADFRETLDYIDKCSLAAENLRKIAPDLVLVVGNEFSLDIKGIIEGEKIEERISKLSKLSSIIKYSLGYKIHDKLNDFLKLAVIRARENFKGEITYASGRWEKVNWEIFDITSYNYYKNIYNSWIYRRTVRNAVRANKKFAISEYGCCSYKGADKKGAWGYTVVDWKWPRFRLKKVLVRDEKVQSDYLLDCLKIFAEEQVSAAFVYTFVARKAYFDTEPLFDLDMANFGLIKVIRPGNENEAYCWEKKKSFEALSKYFKNQ